MGNIFDSCKAKKNIIYNRTLFEPLNINGDPYSSVNLYNNLDFIELNEKIKSIQQKIDIITSNLSILEENTQENIQLLSKDMHHINNKLKIKPPVVV
jgi:hypothetical protein